ncbi:MAG: hypothetical protein PHI49_08770 [Halothiobacillaceae bacterium]|nr:hypothetical protein [Halothiobacillaceae bacterium]
MIIDAWLERVPPRVRILDPESGREVAVFEGESLRELYEEGWLSVLCGPAGWAGDQHELVRQLMLRACARACRGGHCLATDCERHPAMQRSRLPPREQPLTAIPLRRVD